MKQPRLAALLCVFIMGTSHAADAPPQAVPAWLERMLTAANTLDYSGISVYMGDGPLQSMRIIHRIGRQGDEVHTITLNGEAREVQRRRDKVVQIYPDRRLIVEGLNWANPFALALPKNPATLLSYYTFRELGEDRQADRPCLRTAVVPKDANRFGYRLCLDKQTGLLLDAQLLDHDGSIRQQVIFAQVQIGQSIARAQMASPDNWKGFQRRNLQPPRDHEAPTTSPPRWQVEQFPPGFRLMAYEPDYPLAPDISAAHLVASDGLASISVFVTRPNTATAIFSGDTRYGSLNAYGVLREGYQIVVIGEVPYQALHLIGQSIHRIQPDS
jgi:sigma-E factor negative regulatory protein RseB